VGHFNTYNFANSIREKSYSLSKCESWRDKKKFHTSALNKAAISTGMSKNIATRETVTSKISATTPYKECIQVRQKHRAETATTRKMLIRCPAKNVPEINSFTIRK